MRLRGSARFRARRRRGRGARAPPHSPSRRASTSRRNARERPDRASTPTRKGARPLPDGVDLPSEKGADLSKSKFCRPGTVSARRIGGWTRRCRGPRGLDGGGGGGPIDVRARRIGGVHMPVSRSVSVGTMRRFTFWKVRVLFRRLSRQKSGPPWGSPRGGQPPRRGSEGHPAGVSPRGSRGPRPVRKGRSAPPARSARSVRAARSVLGDPGRDRAIVAVQGDQIWIWDGD